MDRNSASAFECCAGVRSLCWSRCFHSRFSSGVIGAARPGFTMASVPSLTLAERQPRTGFKLELVPQVVITGRIIDDVGDPVMGAQVFVFFGRIADGKFTFQPTTGAQSNDLGEFRIPGLQRGKYIVCAGSRCYPGMPDGGRASAMELAPGREARVEINAISDARTVHVRGTVNGLPAGRGLSVSLFPRTNRGMGMKAFAAPVGPNGTFDIAGVTPGSYQLAADYFESGTRMSLRVPVEVGNSDRDGVVAALESLAAQAPHPPSDARDVTNFAKRSADSISRL